MSYIDPEHLDRIERHARKMRAEFLEECFTNMFRALRRVRGAAKAT